MTDQAELDRRSAELRARAATLLGHAPDDRDEGHADAALACMEVVTARLHEPGGPGPVDVLTTLLADLQELVLELQEFQGADRLARIAGCERGLQALRRTSTQSELVEHVCDELARSCGFGRVLLSRVSDGQWRPWKVNGAVRREPWFVAWGDEPIALTELVLEQAVVRARRPGLMRDTSRVDLHPMIRQTLTDSYVAAPIMPSGAVIGLLHGDHMTGGRSCGETDREVIGIFADGFARLYERFALVERFQRRRHDVRATLKLADSALQDLVDFEFELALHPEDASLSVDGLHPPTGVYDTELDRLTPRELDVLRLVAMGANNQEIADSLFVTVATVKSHVNRVLAKLGVRNRSQAIVHYRRAQGGGYVRT